MLKKHIILLFEKKNLVLRMAIFYGLNISAPFIFSTVATRSLTPEEHGILRYVLAIFPFLSIFTLTGYNTITLREVSSEKDIKISDITKISIISGIFFSLLILLLFEDFLKSKGEIFYFFFISILLFLPFAETGTNFKNNLYARKKQKFSLDLQIISKSLFILFFICFIFLIKQYKISSFYILPAYLMANTLSGHFVNFYTATFHSSCAENASPFSYIKEVIALAGASGIWILSNQVDKLLVYHLLGKESMAKYFILVMIPMECGRFIDFSFIVFYKRIFLEAGYKQILKSIKISSCLIIIGIFIILYCFIFKAVAPVVFGSFYTYEYFTIFLSTLMLIGIALEYFILHMVFAIGNAYKYLSYSILSSFTTITFIVSLGTIWKTEGVLLSIFLKCLCAPLLFGLFLKYFHKKSWFC